MKKTVTFKDIAAALNVSVVTVHKAVHNKKGISQGTRERILEYIKQNDYKINKAAAALKRHPVVLVTALIDCRDENRYFYPDILYGVRQAKEELSAFNTEVLEYFFPLSVPAQREVLEEILIKHGDSISGILTSITDEYRLNDIIKQYTDKGITVVTVNNDAIESSRDANISSDGLMAGNVAAELICSYCGNKQGQFLLLAGNQELRNHQENVRGFINTVKEMKPDANIISCHEFSNSERLEKQIKKYLSVFDDIIGIYCNNARNTLTMCKAVRDSGKSPDIVLIGSDVYSELIPFFRDFTLNASIYQYPKEQGYKGLWTLYNIVTGEEKIKSNIKLNIGIAVRSNAESYL